MSDPDQPTYLLTGPQSPSVRMVQANVFEEPGKELKNVRSQINLTAYVLQFGNDAVGKARRG